MAEMRLMDERALETDDRPALKRRGLIAGAASLVAGLVAQRTAEPVGAVDTPVLLGGSGGTGGVQGETAPTWIASGATATPAIRGSSRFTDYVDGRPDGVQGFAIGDSSTGGAGVFARNNTTGGVGVWGQVGTGTAVYGVSSAGGQGVTGVSASSIGVYGVSGGVGVYGTCSSTYAGGAGVYGYAANNGPPAVRASVGAGVVANAVVADIATANQAALSGQTSTAYGIAVYGYAGNANAWAGMFTGKVVVNGDFAVTGAKSAAVPHPDGSLRLLYCVESPEAWFEDFGEGKVAGGVAEVALDPDFLAVVDTGRMHIFLAESGEHHALHVAAKRADGFTVRADEATVKAAGKALADVGTSFSYRVVARRKDVGKNATRLAKVSPAKGPGPSPDAPPPRVEVPKPRSDKG